MMNFYCVFALFFSVAIAGERFAFLIAGSNGYYNYRHQADIAHAYQILTKEGHFHRKNVITMMYDDVANNEENPVRRNLINHPNGTNVYQGKRNIDYSGKHVTADNFLGVLNGTAGGRHFGSLTSDDELFIYYSDHGAVGLVGMPEGEDPLYAHDLLRTLEWMHENKKYKKIVFYLEACESGSMFENLPEDWNIFATTAATANQSSYATYWDDGRSAFLGDEYSVAWMEDSDIYLNQENAETIETQFEHVKKKVVHSQPQQFGDMTINSESIREFQTENERRNLAFSNRISSSDSRDVVMNTLLNRMKIAMEENDSSKYASLGGKYLEEMRMRLQFEYIFNTVTMKLVGGERHANFLSGRVYDEINGFCLKEVYTQFENVCFRFSDFGLKFVKTLVNLCSEFESIQITEELRSSCEPLTLPIIL